MKLFEFLNWAFIIFYVTIIWAVPVLSAITIHEVAHGWVANKLGDKTAAFIGKITLNPFKYINLIGTVLMPLLCLALAGGGVIFGKEGFIFGWAKPIPVLWQNLNNPRRDKALVAAAGLLSNLMMAFIWAIIIKLAMMLTPNFREGSITFYIYWIGRVGISINLMLMVLNFIPIPPLDGGRILASILPRRVAMAYERIEPFGEMILMILIVTGILRGGFLYSIYELFQSLILTALHDSF